MPDPQRTNPKQPFPRPFQVIVLMVCGFAMMFFGCLGALAPIDRTPALGWTLASLAVIGLLGLLVGLALVLFLFIRGVVRAFRTPPQPQPPGPTGAQ